MREMGKVNGDGRRRAFGFQLFETNIFWFHWKGEKFSIPFSRLTRQWLRSREPSPVAQCCSSFPFRHWRGVSSRRGLEKKRKRKCLSLQAASSSSLPGIITHPRSSPILERWHIVTHRIGASEAFQIETTATPFVLFLFSSVFLFLLSLYYYPLLGNACDILFTLHRDESERAVVKMH